MDKDDYLDRVKIGLMKDKENTFILSILFSLKKVWDTQMSGGMLSTNGTNIYINPEYFLNRTMEGAKADLLHESYHVVFNHMDRAITAKLNFKRYNIAADYYINNMLKKSGVEIDDTFLYDRKYDGMAVKEIYDALNKEPEPKDYQPDVIVNEGTPEEQQARDMEIKDIISRAVVQAQMSNDYGSIPTSIKRFIDNLLNPVIDWKTQLSNYFSEYAKEDYSFRKPNRRFPEMIMPSLYSEAFGEIHIAIDCSGSINNKQYKEFLSEVQGIIDTLHPSKTTVRNWGSSLGTSIDVMPDQNIMEECELEYLGGTEIVPVLKEIKKLQPKISAILTDGQFNNNFKNYDPECNVLWVIINNPNFTAPYGEVIYLK